MPDLPDEIAAAIATIKPAKEYLDEITRLQDMIIVLQARLILANRALIDAGLPIPR